MQKLKTPFPDISSISLQFLKNYMCNSGSDGSNHEIEGNNNNINSSTALPLSQAAPLIVTTTSLCLTALSAPLPSSAFG